MYYLSTHPGGPEEAALARPRTGRVAAGGGADSVLRSKARGRWRLWSLSTDDLLDLILDGSNSDIYLSLIFILRGRPDKKTVSCSLAETCALAETAPGWRCVASAAQPTSRRVPAKEVTVSVRRSQNRCTNDALRTSPRISITPLGWSLFSLRRTAQPVRQGLYRRAGAASSGRSKQRRRDCIVRLCSLD